MPSFQPSRTRKPPFTLWPSTGAGKLFLQPNHNFRTMTRNHQSSKAESIIVLIIFLVGALGALYLFAGQSRAASDPSHSIEAPAEMAQLSQEEVYQ